MVDGIDQRYNKENIGRGAEVQDAAKERRERQEELLKLLKDLRKFDEYRNYEEAEPDPHSVTIESYNKEIEPLKPELINPDSTYVLGETESEEDRNKANKLTELTAKRNLLDLYEESLQNSVTVSDLMKHKDFKESDAEMLIRYADHSSNGSIILLEAIKAASLQNKKDYLKTFLKSANNLSFKDEKELFINACKNGQWELVNTMLNKKYEHHEPIDLQTTNAIIEAGNSSENLEALRLFASRIIDNNILLSPPSDLKRLVEQHLKYNTVSNPTLAKENQTLRNPDSFARAYQEALAKKNFDLVEQFHDLMNQKDSRGQKDNIARNLTRALFPELKGKKEVESKKEDSPTRILERNDYLKMIIDNTGVFSSVLNDQTNDQTVEKTLSDNLEKWKDGPLVIYENGKIDTKKTTSLIKALKKYRDEVTEEHPGDKNGFKEFVANEQMLQQIFSYPETFKIGLSTFKPDKDFLDKNLKKAIEEKNIDLVMEHLIIAQGKGGAETKKIIDAINNNIDALSKTNFSATDQKNRPQKNSPEDLYKLLFSDSFLRALAKKESVKKNDVEKVEELKKTIILKKLGISEKSENSLEDMKACIDVFGLEKLNKIMLNLAENFTRNLYLTKEEYQFLFASGVQNIGTDAKKQQDLFEIAYSDDPFRLSTILENEKINTNAINGKGKSLLEAVAENSHGEKSDKAQESREKALKFLLLNGADPTLLRNEVRDSLFGSEIDSRNIHVAHLKGIIKEQSLVEFLTTEGVSKKNCLIEYVGFLNAVSKNEQLNLNFGVDPTGNSLLKLAVHANDEQSVEYLLRNGASADYSNIHGDTPLHSAVQHNNVKIINALIKNSENIVNKANKMGRYPLDIAIFYGNQEAIEILIRSGANKFTAEKYYIENIQNVALRQMLLECKDGNITGAIKARYNYLPEGATVPENVSPIASKDGKTLFEIACGEKDSGKILRFLKDPDFKLLADEQKSSIKSYIDSLTEEEGIKSLYDAAKDYPDIKQMIATSVLKNDTPEILLSGSFEIKEVIAACIENKHVNTIIEASKKEPNAIPDDLQIAAYKVLKESGKAKKEELENFICSMNPENIKLTEPQDCIDIAKSSIGRSLLMAEYAPVEAIHDIYKLLSDMTRDDREKLAEIIIGRLPEISKIPGTAAKIFESSLEKSDFDTAKALISKKPSLETLMIDKINKLLQEAKMQEAEIQEAKTQEAEILAKEFKVSLTKKGSDGKSIQDNLADIGIGTDFRTKLEVLAPTTKQAPTVLPESTTIKIPEEKKPGKAENYSDLATYMQVVGAVVVAIAALAAIFVTGGLATPVVVALAAGAGLAAYGNHKKHQMRTDENIQHLRDEFEAQVKKNSNLSELDKLVSGISPVPAVDSVTKPEHETVAAHDSATPHAPTQALSESFYDVSSLSNQSIPDTSFVTREGEAVRRGKAADKPIELIDELEPFRHIDLSSATTPKPNPTPKPGATTHTPHTPHGRS